MNELRQRIIDCIDRGMTVKQIEAETGAGRQNIYATAHRYGRRFDNGNIPVLTGKEKEIKDLIKQGTPYKAIARKYGVTRQTARIFCERIGATLSDEQKKANEERFAGKPQNIDEVIQKVNTCGKGVEYVGGYVNNHSPIIVRRKACGHQYSKRYDVILFHLGDTCPICKAEREAEKREQKQKAEAKKAREREKREAERARAKARAEKEAERKRSARIHPCPVCGEITSRRKYCSNVCQKRAENKRHEIKRRAKIKIALVDRDITLEGLYRRDGGRCHICGMQCNYEDYVVKDGAFIVGDWYPSIDHVIPLSKGGLHAWANVKLAHRRCNTWKSDRRVCPGV